MSIKKTFRNFVLSLFTVLLLLLVSSYAYFNTHLSLSTTDTLSELRNLGTNILQYQNKEPAVAQGLVKEHLLNIDIKLEALKAHLKHDYISSFILKNNPLPATIKNIEQFFKNLKTKASAYYKQPSQNLKKEIKTLLNTMPSTFDTYVYQLINNYQTLNQYYLYLSLFNTLNLFFIILWYARKLSIIKQDINTLLLVDQEDRSKTYRTQEFIAIKRKMERRPMAGGGKNLIDPLTGILNEKGLLTEFAQRGNFSAKDYICVTIFDIDNFKELEMKYSRAFTDTIVKKFAFILGLEKKAADIIARIGEDKFVVVMAREQKDQAFNAMDHIRKLIEKTVFKPNRSEKVTTTVSGGFALKDKHEKLESTLSAANSLVRRAKLNGKNNIAKLHDFDAEKNSRM